MKRKETSYFVFSGKVKTLDHDVTKTSMFSVQIQAGRYLILGSLYAMLEVYSGRITSRTGKQSIK